MMVCGLCVKIADYANGNLLANQIGEVNISVKDVEKNIRSNMAPYDGSGYGHSVYWRKTMLEIAESNGEICKCWVKDNPTLNFCGEESFEIVIECKEKKEDCSNTFKDTQKELLSKFKNFYKV